MALTWTRDNPALWDADKQRILGAALAGSLPAYDMEDGTAAPGDWFRVQRDGDTVGFGWMDTVWGDAEVLAAVDPAHQGWGVGTFIMENLETEAGRRGLNRIYNAVRPDHPKRQTVMAWLGRRGFSGAGDHEQLQRVVRQKS